MENDLANSLKMFYESSEHRYIDQFFRDTYSLGYRSAFYITHNKADAEDVLQISYHVILESKKKCQAALEGNNEKTKSWFLSIVLNHARMLIRSKERKMKREKKVSDSQRRTAENVGFDSGDETVLNAMKQLPEKYRTPLFLKYYEGLENNRISEVLSMKRTTLRSILKRGIDQLRDILSDSKYVSSGVIILAIRAFKFNNVEASEVHLTEFANPDVVSKMQSSFSYAKNVALLKTAAIYISILAVIGFSFPAYQNFIENTASIPFVLEESPTEEWPKVFDKTNWKDSGLRVKKGLLKVKDDNLITDPNKKVWFTLDKLPKDSFTIKFDLIAYSENKKFLNNVISGFFEQKGYENFGDLNYYKNKKYKNFRRNVNAFPYRDKFHSLNFQRELLFHKNEIFIIENGVPISKQRVEGHDGHNLSYGVSLEHIDIRRIEIGLASKELIENAINQPYELQVSKLKKGENYRSMYSEKK
ncbi:MAG: hypothetical protein COA79_19495 [Planctomycetota bacterium]|nr:MAG: hypothetical protein COA79_19495 [Planctomycetota bacterium]